MAEFKDKELQAYSQVMEIPVEQEDGFSFRVAICAFLLGLFMMPAMMYLELVVGQSLGPHGRWVAVILFMEMLRKSRSAVKKQELYILFSMAGLLISNPFSGLGAAGQGAPVSLLWAQYLRQSPFLEGMGMADMIPEWVAPAADSESYVQRTFFHRDWAIPMAIIGFRLLISRVDEFGLGLALYHITAKVEKLPFPMAPIGAMGSIALAEQPEARGAWRWRVFCVGSALGIVWGVVYMGVPILTELIFGERFELFPIPWVETSQMTETWLPAVPTGVILDVTLFIFGMVMPFWGVIGMTIGAVFTMCFNPILHSQGVLTTWHPGMDTVQTAFSNNIDFYFSFGLGLSLAIALIGLTHAFWSIRKARKQEEEPREEQFDPEALNFRQRLRRNRRGIVIGLAVYLLSAASYGSLVMILIPTFPIAFLLGYSLIYVPFISYVTARMEGLVGQAVEIPFVREASLILSGVRGMGIWFAPLPVNNYGRAAIRFRQMELTGTKIRSVAYSHLLAVPIIVLASLLASQFIWQLAEVPSQAFPHAERMWELQIRNQAILWSATTGGDSLFMEAWNPRYLLIGLGSGLGLASVLVWMKLPLLLFYGVIGGLHANIPHAIILTLAGAVFARFYLWKVFGKQVWLRTAPVLAAGFGCGFGLSGMFAFGIVLIQRTITALPW